MFQRLTYETFNQPTPPLPRQTLPLDIWRGRVDDLLCALLRSPSTWPTLAYKHVDWKSRYEAGDTPLLAVQFAIKQPLGVRWPGRGNK